MQEREINNQEEIVFIKGKVENELKTLGLLEKYGEFKINKISDDIYSVTTIKSGNIQYFVNKEGKPILNIIKLGKHPNFQNSQIESGYWEKKDPDGTYNFYKIKEIKIDNGTIKPILGDKIDKYSLEYFNVWMYINFANDRIVIQSMINTKDIPNLIKNGKKYTNEQGYYMIDIELMPIFIKSQTIRIRDLVSFKEHGQISKEVFDKYLPQVRKLLLKQIGDKRFDRVNDGVSKTELDGYLKGGYISQELYVEAIKLMVELGKLDKKILDELKKEIKPKLSELEDEIKLG